MEWFVRIRADSKKNTVTILKTGILNINTLTFSNYFEKSNFNHVLLGYDCKINKVAIKLVDSKVKGSYLICIFKRRSSICLKGFLKAMGIKHIETKSYDVKWDSSINALTFEIKGG